jgi:LPS-assembly protein
MMLLPHLHAGRLRARGFAFLVGLLCCVLAALPGAARAQDAEFATLVADSLFIDGPNRLIAEGNVEALFGEARLRARRISYDRATGQIEIEGPLVLHEGREVLILADQADLSDDLQRGLIRSARVVFDEQLQIAAGSVERLDGRFTEMDNVVASSCEVCANRRTPLWEIRARRVVHDDAEQQVYFEGAQFRLFGLPVAYIPRLRVPDPRLERATGFLSPRLSLDTGHGLGLRAPYFIVLGTNRDLTLTPFVGLEGTKALQMRYRQAFASGNLELGGLIARDTIRPGSLRGFAQARGDFALGQDYRLRFNLIQPGDRSVLEDYDIGGPLLTSDVTIDRIDRDARLRVQALQFRSLRLEDNNATLPNRVGQAVIERRMGVPGVGGVAGYRLEAHLLRRDEALTTGQPESVPGIGTVTRPRKQSRLSLDLDWRRDAVLPAGVLGAVGVHLGLDHFRLGESGGDFPTQHTRMTPGLLAELRWPLVRHGPGGATHLIEPVAQVIWRPTHDTPLPYEGSRMSELDEGNLFTFDRFASRETREQGLRANLGLSWTRQDPDGWSGTLSVGRIMRAGDPGQFSDANPLAGARSDWLVAGTLETGGGLTLGQRVLVDADLGVQRAALEVDWSSDRASVSTSYARILADPFEDRDDKVSEWRFEGSRQITDHWAANVGWSYDMALGQAAQANLGLSYENECLRMGLEIDRRFASASSRSSRTRFGLNVDILGIGGNPSQARRACSEM